MQNSRGVVAGIDAPERIGNDRLPEIALGVALCDSGVDGVFKAAADKVDILTDFAKITAIPVSWQIGISSSFAAQRLSHRRHIISLGTSSVSVSALFLISAARSSGRTLLALMHARLTASVMRLTSISRIGLSPHENLAVADNEQRLCEEGQRIGIEQAHIGILADFERADAVGDSAHLGGIYGYGSQRIIMSHALAHGKSRAQRQILDRDNRMVGDYSGLYARFAEHARGCGGGIFELGLAAVADERSAERLDTGFRESVGNKMTLSAVDNAIIEPELLGDTHGGEDIIGAVGMNMHLHMLLKQRSESFELCVELAARLIFLIYSRVFVNCSLIIAAVAILVLGAIFFSL